MVLYYNLAVRNDRNKKRKPKAESCVSSQQSTEELTPEEEEIITKIVRAHEQTFPMSAEDEKYNLVSVKFSSYCIIHNK